MKGISGTTLKIIAVVTMLIDHIGAALIENGILCAYDPVRLQEMLSTSAGIQWLEIDRWLRTIGRISFPIFCFLLVEGFMHSKDTKKYAKRLLVFAFISEIPFDLAFFNTWIHMGHQNVYFTLLIGLLVLIGLEKYGLRGNIGKQFLTIAAGCFLAVTLKTDYDAAGVLIITVFYLFRFEKGRQIAVSGGLLAIESIQNYGAAALALIPICFYHGQRGKLKLKYFFYWFYPVHILILYVLRGLIFKGA